VTDAGGEVTTIQTLPDTGAGDQSNQPMSWIGAVMAGGAAVLAARVLRRKPGEKSQDA
jgi:LPXTG-motif cell wall-anchored protein